MSTRISARFTQFRRQILVQLVKLIAPTKTEICLTQFVGREDLAPIALFRLDGWNEVLYRDLNLSPEDSVCVLGAYLGDSISEYRNRFDSPVIGLEPISEFCTNLNLRFKTDPKVKILEVAASDRNESLEINLLNDSTSFYKEGHKSEKIISIDIVELFESLEKPPHVLELNIEGVEFRVLNRLLDSSYASSVNILLIQFHDFVEDSDLMRAEIRKRLSRDYVEVFCYPYVWERWDLKPEISKF